MLTEDVKIKSKVKPTNNMSSKIFIILVAFVTGVILTVFSYQAVTIYQLRTQIANDHATLTQIVDFLNKNIQGAQSAQTVQQAPATSAKK